MGLFSGIGKVVKKVAGIGSSLLGSVTGGDVLGFGGSLLGGMMQNSSSRSSVAEQMAFQKMMSDTSYQRTMADMRAAGLNPMLAYSQGGASTPSGANYSATDVVSPAISSARQGSRVRAEIANLNEQNKNLIAQNKQIEADTALKRASTASAMADIPIKHATALNLDTDYKLKTYEFPAVQTQFDLERSPIGEKTRILDRIVKSLTGALKAGSSAKALNN